jgi:hypothetical protein
MSRCLVSMLASLTTDEAVYVSQMVRRIAAILGLGEDSQRERRSRVRS